MSTEQNAPIGPSEEIALPPSDLKMAGAKAVDPINSISSSSIPNNSDNIANSVPPVEKLDEVYQEMAPILLEETSEKKNTLFFMRINPFLGFFILISININFYYGMKNGFPRFYLIMFTLLLLIYLISTIIQIIFKRLVSSY